MDITIYQINMGRDHNRIAFEGLDLLRQYQGSDKIIRMNGTLMSVPYKPEPDLSR